jgi:methoxymalonate biosynthesis acyl carrier protein
MQRVWRPLRRAGKTSVECAENSTLVEHLGTLFAERFHINVPSAKTDLLGTGLLDSLQLVELLLHLEQRFGVRVPVDSIELDDLRTLERLAGVVAALRASTA